MKNDNSFAVKALRLSLAMLLCTSINSAFAQERNIQGQGIVLQEDEKPAFPHAPEGYDKLRQGIPHGKVDTVTYDSKSVGTKRKMSVYTPPGYDKNPTKKYPVFYLISGTTDTEETFFKVGKVNLILDNLIAQGKAKPMIMIFFFEIVYLTLYYYISKDSNSL